MTSEDEETAKQNISYGRFKTVYEALAPILSESQTTREQGAKYEALCAYFLKADPYWSKYYSRVGTLEQAAAWPDSPVFGQNQDIGFDLIAQTAASGEWHAIQCKCYDPDKPLPKGVCDSFFAALMNRKDIADWLIMTSAGGPGKNLEQQMSGDLSRFIDTAKMAASNLDWSRFIDGLPPEERVTYDPLPHQRKAIDGILSEFGEHDRCKAIMACGTGKTLMSLRLTEEWLNGGPGVVLFCAPSISLVGQSMREWMAQARIPLSPLVVCSDAKASRRGGEDSTPMTLADFEYPATTNPESLMRSYRAHRASNPDGAVVVFSTYQSIDVIHRAQELGLPEFDLIVCDEAHRTTGNALPGVSTTEASAFMKVHYNENVLAKKRLYMTATPRIYGETAKRKGAEEDYTIASMDDEEIYGRTAYQIKFGEAVEKKLLTDYKVIVLTVQEDALTNNLPSLESDQGVDAVSLQPSDIGKIIGCWKGLIDHGEGAPKDAIGLGDMLVVDDVDRIDSDAAPLHRAVGFCSTIDASKTICEAFARIVEDYAGDEPGKLPLRCDLRHVDGNMPADRRARNIAWLGENVEDDECRILTNARCLAEGIDVPNLDAVIFFNAKNSTVDVVQAVGRVMRRAEGKKFGYIILPIFVPAGMTPEEALDDSKVFANVWSILQALRSHDERIEAKVNALALHQEAAKNKYQGAANHKGWDEGLESRKEAEQKRADEIIQGVQMRLSLYPVDRWEKAVKTQLVKKCGTRIYWDEWAEDVARIAERHIERIGALVKDDKNIRKQFDVFLKGLRDSLNPGITEDEAVQMIAQHIITMPVFEALFGEYEFAKSNPVSITIDSFLSSLQEQKLNEDSDVEVLEDVYASVRRRAAMVTSDAAKQQLIRDLYEKFFKVAFKATSEKMGIVYTPNEVVNYILHATDRLLQKEFGQRLSDEGVNILDPFTGTGTFIVNLLQDEELMPADKLSLKYRDEIWCNEILLLAYYIATINIEYAYHSRVPEKYVPFVGAVLTDTFQMYEEGDSLDLEMFTDNTERILEEMEASIHVIVGNPPYSIGQKDANDNNKNVDYKTLDSRIGDTYAKGSAAGLKKGLYDQYIRAFRWATDRIAERGIVSFVTNGGWLDAQAMDGFRKCLVEEFNSIYVFNLRGNQRTQGEQSRKEGGKIFGSGSRAPIAITMLVKNPASEEHGAIHYHDIGDYLDREMKLAIIASAINGEPFEWDLLKPDKYGDWLNQRDDSWYDYAPLGLEKYKAPTGIFETWSLGIATNRDDWMTGFSKYKVINNINNMIDFYNEEAHTKSSIEDITFDPTRISWTETLQKMAIESKELSKTNAARLIAYRPFCKEWTYIAEAPLVHRPYQQFKLFPCRVNSDGEYEPLENIAICLCGNKGFSANVTDIIPDLHFVGDAQCFPLYWYEKMEVLGGMFADESNEYIRHDAITDEALSIFQKVYPRVFDGHGKTKARASAHGGIELTKEDIFYYIYGVLHSPEYRRRFEANLKKELPRIPLAEDFRAFSLAGRRLVQLHLEYESVQPWPLTIHGDASRPGRVQKMKWGKCKDPETGKKVDDHTTLIYNENLTFADIPEAANDYKVNGRSPLEWIIDRYQVKRGNPSGIVNDPNDYSDDPTYISGLIPRLVTVAMDTLGIMKGLPPLKERPQPADWPFAWKAGE